jgi:hypothetical protein
VCCLALTGAVFTPSAQADAWNRKTVFTFSNPVEIPGVHLAGWGVLPAGTYVFKILDSQSNRHIVQIFNKDETQIYATILAIPNFRLKPRDNAVMTFHERPAGQPEALRAWFYPGRQWGEEFVYPKAKALELAKASEKPVLFTPTEVPAEVTEAIKPADTPVEAPVVAELRRAPVMAATPAGKEEPMAQSVTPPPSQPEIAAAPLQKLPETASPLPLMALFGLLSMGGVIVLRTAERRIR